MLPEGKTYLPSKVHGDCSNCGKENAGILGFTGRLITDEREPVKETAWCSGCLMILLDILKESAQVCDGCKPVFSYTAMGLRAALANEPWFMDEYFDAMPEPNVVQFRPSSNLFQTPHEWDCWVKLNLFDP